MSEDTPSPPIQAGPPGPEYVPASLWKDGREISKGWIHPEEVVRNGNFYPIGLPLMDIARQGLVLRVKGMAKDIPLKEVFPCPANRTDHWHYRVSEPQE